MNAWAKIRRAFSCHTRAGARAPAHDGRNALTASPGWTASRRLRILVAEDTDTIQQLIGTVLCALGHHIVIAENGRTALAKLADEAFDIVIMDVRMPVMDGLQAIAQIRSPTNAKAKIPVIALTADDSPCHISEFLNAGFDCVCTKPINFAELLNAINDLLESKIHTAAQQTVASQRNVPTTGRITEPVFTQRKDNFADVLERIAKMAEAQPKSISPYQANAAAGDELAKQLDELLTKYEERLVEQCDKLKVAFDAFANSPDDADRREALLRLTHAIKGGGGTYGYNLVTEIAAAPDELLNGKAKLDPADISTIARHVEALALVADKQLSGDGGRAGQLLLARLRNTA